MPELGIVIPTLGRAAALPRVLEGLERQRAGAGSFEVTVVVDPQDGPSAPAAVRRAVAGRPYATCAIASDAPGASAARNRGWARSDARLILFLGDDTLPHPELVSEHLGWHRRHPDERIGVLGHVRWARELKVTPFMRWLDHGIQFDYPAIAGTEAGWGRFYTANASVKRTLLERVGGFDEQRLPYLYEDLDLAYRMSRLGFRLLYNRRAAVDHLHQATIESWRRRVAQLAAAEREFVRLHPEIPPYFKRLFEDAASRPAARGRGRYLTGLVGPQVPWLGPRAWESADLFFRQALASDFLDAWKRAARGTRASLPQPEPDSEIRARSGGSEPGRPK